MSCYLPETDRPAREYVAQWSRTASERVLGSPTAIPSTSMGASATPSGITLAGMKFWRSDLIEFFTQPCTKYIFLGVWFAVFVGSIIFLTYNSFESYEDVDHMLPDARLPDIMDLSYFTRTAFNIVCEILSVVPAIVEYIVDLITFFGPWNFTRAIRYEYQLFRILIDDIKRWTIRTITTFRFNALTDWAWLKIQQIRGWIAKHIVFLIWIVLVFLLFFYKDDITQERSVFAHMKKYQHPKLSKTDGYRGSTTTAMTTTKATTSTPRILQFADVPEPTGFWSTYGDSIRGQNDATESLTESNDGARASAVGLDFWESQSESFQKTPTPRQNDYPGEYWNNPQPEELRSTTIVSKDLHYCIACKQWHCCELPY